MEERLPRIGNFLIDSFVFAVVAYLIALALSPYAPKDAVKYIAIALYFTYYFCFEYFAGQTIGKMLTNTCVISRGSNKRPSIIQIVSRTLLRFILLDTLSYIFMPRGLHDRLTFTAVAPRRTIS